MAGNRASSGTTSSRKRDGAGWMTAVLGGTIAVAILVIMLVAWFLIGVGQNPLGPAPLIALVVSALITTLLALVLAAVKPTPRSTLLQLGLMLPLGVLTMGIFGLAMMHFADAQRASLSLQLMMAAGGMGALWLHLAQGNRAPTAESLGREARCAVLCAVLGGFSLMFSAITGVAAVVVGVVALESDDRKLRRIAKVGITLGALTSSIGIALTIGWAIRHLLSR